MPAGTPQPDRPRPRLDKLRERVELLISGRPPDDPLYLTNRTWPQKLKIASLIGLPVVLVAALVMMGATDRIRMRTVDTYEHPPSAAPARAVPQEHVPDGKLTAADLEVVNIRIARDAAKPMVTGVVRNNTNQKVASAEVSYYLADDTGSLVGTETTDVQNVQPHGSVTFRRALNVDKAEYVIVRDVHAN